MLRKNESVPGRAKAIFLDRDGVINELVYYPDLGLVDSPCRVNDFHIIKGVPAAIRAFNKLGFKVIVITNQPGIAKGRFDEKMLQSINRKMERLLNAGGARLDAVYQCLHHPEGSRWGEKKYIRKCACRKPLPGMFFNAAAEHNIDLASSYMVGDDIGDVEASLRAGVKPVFLGNMRCGICRLMTKKKTAPGFIFRDLAGFASYIKGIIPRSENMLPGILRQQKRKIRR